MNSLKYMNETHKHYCKLILINRNLKTNGHTRYKSVDKLKSITLVNLQ